MPNPLKRTLKRTFQSVGYEVRKLPTNAWPALDLSRLSGSDRLVAGPFLGEFGWELMQWQAYLRQLSKFYETTVVYGRASSAYFYKDFVSEYRVVDCDSWDTAGYELYGFDYEEWALQFTSTDLLVADNRCYQLCNYFVQSFAPYGSYDQGKSYDIVIHARDVPTLVGNAEKHKRNWPRERWDQLCDRLNGYRLAAVGIPELSYCPDSVADLRGIDTEELCSVLASSALCIGPSSGLMHLATLCRTPQLIWTSEDYTFGFGGTAYRYARSWNPFATPVVTLTEMGINPSVECVETALRDFLARLPTQS